MLGTLGALVAYGPVARGNFLIVVVGWFYPRIDWFRMVQVQLEVPLVPLLIWEATLGSVGSSWDLRLPSTSGRNLRALSCSLAEVEMCTIPSCLAGDDWQTCQS